jgi:hypothetical protein
VGNASIGNEGDGISALFESSVVGNQIVGNGEYGIRLRETTTYRDNTIAENTLGAVDNFIDSTPGINLGGNHCAGPNVTASSCP